MGKVMNVGWTGKVWIGIGLVRGAECYAHGGRVMVRKDDRTREDRLAQLREIHPGCMAR